ncbi:MAG: hypothetical protein HY055_00960 [Magnetospirillum sp.]|nr:hypothetical protein [Magnetospirillum sp.]
MKALTALIGLALLTGCTANEKARPVKLDKGTYMGLRDGEIAAPTRLALAQRIAGQIGGTVRLATDGPATNMPMGEAVPSGRVTGQNY